MEACPEATALGCLSRTSYMEEVDDDCGKFRKVSNSLVGVDAGLSDGEPGATPATSCYNLELTCLSRQLPYSLLLV
jgi:hypothetical protein